MIYEFKSKDGQIIEEFYKASGKVPKQIKRNGILYKRIISMPMMAIVGSKEAKTLGSLAEKNTEKMIKEGKIKPKEKKLPWWRTSKKVDTSLANMSKKQKERYIREGRK